jgi:hypothetical protein
MNQVRMALLAALICAGLMPDLARAAEAAGGAGPIYVRLTPVSFSVIGASNKIEEEVSLMLVLELETGKTEDVFRPFRRQVLDGFLVALNELYDGKKPGDPPVPVDDIKDRLMQVATDITGPGFIRSVLVTSIGERVHSR